MKQTVHFEELGVMEYQHAWDYQEKLLGRNVELKASRWRADGEPPVHPADTENHLLFVEHPPVYTLGKSGKIENVLISEERRQQDRIGFYRINRGGDITFHGPGQLVAYPIFDLENFYTDIGRFLRNLEEVIILTLADYGIVAGRSQGETGVWLDAGIKGAERKICAIGIRCSRWITMHGLALNVNTNLDYFNNIIPCGIVGKGVTSLQQELGHPADMDGVKGKVRQYFQEVFEVDWV